MEAGLTFVLPGLDLCTVFVRLSSALSYSGRHLHNFGNVVQILFSAVYQPVGCFSTLICSVSVILVFSLLDTFGLTNLS